MSKERQQIRYWFYPDKIRTVTDGQIAAVEQCQFYAAVERTVGGETKTMGRRRRND